MDMDLSEINHHKKLGGYDFWEKILKKPKFIVAPMVDQSELAWRMMSRKYGAQLCYTPMFHASVFKRNAQYRKEALLSCDGDRPLIFQFCANDPDVLIEAALIAQDHCDAIDINLGCPQTIARRGYYGAFLSENWDLVAKLVKVCHERLSVPITCKIRIFTDIQKTVNYAKMLESAGCQLLAVHGRTKEMKGPLTGLASWKHIKAVKEAVSIPVVANGNIQYKADIDRCLVETGVDGVMIAEGSLHNPTLFVDGTPLVWDMAFEYIEYATKYPCPTSYARGHIFKLCHHGLQRHIEARSLLSNSKNLEDMKAAIILLRDTCKSDCWSDLADRTKDKTSLPYQHWFCQPYVRPTPVKSDPSKVCNNITKSQSNTMNDNISKKKLKKLLKRGYDISFINELNPSEKASKIANFLQASKTPKPVYKICVKCGNPGGNNCVFLCCKPCCKARMRELNVVCSYHKSLKQVSDVLKQPQTKEALVET